MRDSKLIKVQCLIFFSSLMVSMLGIYPVFAHTNYPHDSIKPKSISEPKSSVSNPQITPKQTENFSVKITTQTKTLSSSFILPTASEILFLLLVINPFLLYTLRNKLHNLNQ